MHACVHSVWACMLRACDFNTSSQVTGALHSPRLLQSSENLSRGNGFVNMSANIFFDSQCCKLIVPLPKLFQHVFHILFLTHPHGAIQTLLNANSQEIVELPHVFDGKFSSKQFFCFSNDFI